MSRAIPFDDFDIEASGFMTIMALEGCSLQTQDKIAARLRELAFPIPSASGHETTDAAALPDAVDPLPHPPRRSGSSNSKDERSWLTKR